MHGSDKALDGIIKVGDHKMKYLIILTFIIILPVYLFGQLTEYNSIFFSHFSDTPQADIKQNGVGNYGFNNYSGFNLNCNDSPININKNFYLATSILLNLNMEGSGSKNVNWAASYINKTSIIPEFLINYRTNDYLIQLNLLTTKILNMKADKDSGDWWAYNYYFGKLKPKQTNSVLQIAVSKKLNNRISLTGGFLTNSFVYSFNEEEKGDSFKISTSFFNQIQFKSSINYQLNNKLKMYVLFKSQKTRVKLTPNKFEKLTYEGENVQNSTTVSFPGLISIGLQKNFYKKINATIEFLNHFLLADEKITVYNWENIEETSNYTHNTWNHEIVGGISYLQNESLQFGLLYSYYTKYDYEINDLGEFLSQKQHPQSLILSSLFNYRIFDIAFDYQFSRHKSIIDIDDVEGETYYTFISHFLKLKIGVNF